MFVNKSKSLEDRALEKLQGEMNAFIVELKTKTPDEIVESAYEIIYKEEILGLFYVEEAFSNKQYKTVLKMKKPLNTMYQDWLEYDSTDSELLKECVNETLNSYYINLKSRQNVDRESR